MDIGAQIEEVRGEFPILKYKTYLNCAAHGPAMKRVLEAVKTWWQFRMYENEVHQPDVKGEAAKLLHVTPEEICLISRVTQGINIVAGMIPFEKGDKIVSTELAYPSNLYPFMPFQRMGVEIERILHHNGLIDTSDFEKTIDDNTKLVCISHVEWTSGLRYDMKAISEIAHDHGAYVMDDAYQAMGPIDVNVRDDNVDFFAAGSEKWMCCPSMSGVLYVRKDLIPQFEPSYRFYNQVEAAFKNGAPWEKPSHDNIKSYDSPLYGNADKYYRGTVSEEFNWGFHACLEYFNKLTSVEIEKRTAKLSGYLIEKLKEQGVKVNTPEEPKKRGGLVTYNTGSYEKNKLIYDTLKKNNIIVAHRYNGGIGGIRVSCHFYNTEDDLDKVLEVNKKILT